MIASLPAIVVRDSALIALRWPGSAAGLTQIGNTGAVPFPHSAMLVHGFWLLDWLPAHTVQIARAVHLLAMGREISCSRCSTKPVSPRNQRATTAMTE